MTNPIRDYLYLDIDRVRSIYAQASGGLTESIRQLQEEVSVNIENDGGRSDSIGQKILLGSGRIATQVLHDYLFTSVESKLSERIIDVSGDTVSDVVPGTLFRVSGKAEIDDIERMLNIMENYNDMYKYLLAIQHSTEIQEMVWELEDQLHGIDISQKASDTRNAKKRKKDAEIELKELAPENISSRILRERRAGISPIISETFRRVYGLLYKEIFEVKIVSNFDESMVFRGILNKEHLREDPANIYAKYGSRPSVHWTMVGQVATMKTPEELKTGDDIMSDNEHEEDSVEDETEPDLRDSFENLYASIAKVEEILIGPGMRTTWIATPLAIYHEVV